jgi:hypothetical protein
MIKRPDLLEAFERARIRNAPPDYFRNLRIVEALYEEAKALRCFPLKDPLAGLERDIRLAKILNVSTPPRQNR